MGDNDIYYVEKILDRRKVNDRYEYKIKWEGYPLNQSTWEPLENLQTAMELVNEFDKVYEQQNKNKNESKNNSYLKKKRLLKKEVKKEENGKEEIEQKEEKNENIPVEEENNFSGKISLRISPTVHRNASAAAKKEGISLNQFFNDAIVSYVNDFKSEVIDFAMPYLLFYQKKELN